MSVNEQRRSILHINNHGATQPATTVNMKSWLTQPSPKTQKRVRKSKGAKQVVNPIFAQCAAILTDTYWVTIFNNAAYGKLPKRFVYKDGILSYRKGARSIPLEVSNNPYEAASACTDFFRRHGGMISEIDQEIASQERYFRTCGETEDIKWGRINKNLREVLIDLFIEERIERYGLTRKESQQLRHIINVGMILGFFNSSNIAVSHKRIINIDGLLFDDVRRTFFVDPNLQPRQTRSYSKAKELPPSFEPRTRVEKDTIPTFYLKWAKFVDSLEKKTAKVNRRNERVNIIQQGKSRLHIVSDIESTPSEETNSTIDTDTDV